MRPAEIRALMNQITQPELGHVMPTDEESGDDLPDVLSVPDVSSLGLVDADGFQHETAG